MALDDRVIARLQHLIDEGQRLRVGDEHESAETLEQCQDCLAWLVSAQNAVRQISEPPDSPYRSRVDSIAVQDHGWLANQAVGEVTAILRHLLDDADAGLLASIADHARAEILDDFLDTADVYLAEGRKNEAGVVAGVVFEDTIRRTCRKQAIDEKGLKLDDLISRLSSSGHLSAVQAKRARVAAHVRTKATHAQWDEFEVGDVGAAIDVTREIIASELDA